MKEETEEKKKKPILKNKAILIFIIVFFILFLTGASYGLYKVVKNYEDKNDSADSDDKNGGNSQKDQELIDLVAYKGSVWAAKIPQNWQTSETESGIDIYDPDDDMKTGASSVAAVGWFGQSNPDEFINWVLNQIGASNVKFLSESSEAPIKEPLSGREWNMKTKIITFTDNKGREIKAKVCAGVLNGYGQYIALFSAFQTTSEKWDEWALVLERVAQSIVIIDSSKVGGIDKVRLPTAADLANDTSPLMEAWKYRQSSQSKTSHEWSDAILGRESDLVSPSTGRKYDLSLSAYDPTVGGYHNPDNFSEILYDPYAD